MNSAKAPPLRRVLASHLDGEEEGVGDVHQLLSKPLASSAGWRRPNGKPRRLAIAVPAGVPQGSVISLTIFILFGSNYPYNVQIQLSYADDVLAAHSSLNPKEAADALNVHRESIRT